MRSARKDRVSPKRPRPDANIAHGMVEDIAYLGDMSVYHVRLDNGRVVASGQPSRTTEDPLTWNDRAWVSFKPDAGVVLTR